MPIVNHKSQLTSDDRKKLLAQIREAENRGLPVYSILRQRLSEKTKPWKTDSNGYFPRRDGKFFVPYPEQKDFVESHARFSLLIAGRGCISGDALIDEIPIGDVSSNKFVDSIFGKTFAFAPFIKGKDDLYKVITQSGLEVSVTKNHQFLTPYGWLPLNQIRRGFSILVDGTSHAKSSIQTALNSQDYYFQDFRLCDVLRNLSEQVFLNILLQLHKIAYESSALDFSYLLSIVDSFVLRLYQLSLEYSDGLISYESFHLELHKCFQSLYNSLRLSICEQLLHQEYDNFFLSLPYRCEYLTYAKHTLETILEDLNYEQFVLEFGVHDSDNIDIPDHNSCSLSYLENSCSPLIIQLSDDSPFEILEFSQSFLETLKTQLLSGVSFCHSYSNLRLLLYQKYQPSFWADERINYFVSRFYRLPHQKYEKYSLFALQESFFEFLYRFCPNLLVLVFQSSSPPLMNNVNYNKRFDKIVSINYDKFSEFYDLNVPIIHHYSANGIIHHNSGKSCAGVHKALGKIKQGHSGAVLNPKFENFKDSTWPEFREWIPWDYVVPDHRYRSEVSWEPQRPFKITFINGASVICKGLHDPSSARGPNLNWLWFDEAQDDPDGMAWKIAIASVRVGNNPQAWATATGRGKLHWMYNFFVEQEFPPDVLEEMQKIQELNGEDVPLIEWFEGTIFDNKDNLDPMFFASMLASYPEGYLRDQELYGKFSDPGGNLGNPAWFTGKIIPEPPATVENRVRYWDLAASEKKVAGKKSTDPDETVGTLFSWYKDGEVDKFCIEDQFSGFWEWADIKEKIIHIARLDGPFVPIYIEEEPGSGGINQVKQIREEVDKELPGWTVRAHNPRREGGDKVVRANIWFAEAARGHVYMVQGNWNQPFLRQLSSFPNAKHDDKIDGVSGARICCAPIFKWKKMKFVHVGMNIRDEKNSSDNIITENTV